MSGITLLDLDILALIVLEVELASLDVLLGIVPGATRVGGRESNLDTRDDAASEDTVGALVAEEHSTEERADDDEEAWGNHLLEGGVGGDSNAVLEVWLGFFASWGSLGHGLELSLDLLEHVLSGITDSLHGHGREPVGEHSADEETSEGEGLKDVDLVGVVDGGSLRGYTVSPVHVANGVGGTGHEGTEEGESDEASGADGETFADSGGGVASSVEVVGVVTNVLVEVGHLSDATSVVGDRAIAVNGEGNRKAAEHAKGSQSDTVHGSELERDKNGDSEAENGNDAGKVSESETVDDVGGGTVGAGFSKLLGGSVLFGGVVLSDEADEETGPKTEDDADIGLPGGELVNVASERKSHYIGENVDSGDNQGGHEDSGNPELDLESGLDRASHFIDSDVSEELADERGNDTNGSDNEREVDGIGGASDFSTGGGDDEGGTGGLSKGTEKISAHTGDVTNVITDVVSDGAWVLGGVFGEGSIDLASKISTHISSLGVDTTADTAEKGDSGATETVARDELEEELNIVHGLWVESSLVGENKNLEDKEGKADEAESEDLAALEGNFESLELLDVAEIGGLVVANGCDHHADVTTEHGGASANEEGDGSVGELRVSGPWHVDGAKHEDGE